MEPDKYRWGLSSVLIINFEQIRHNLLVLVSSW